MGGCLDDFRGQSTCRMLSQDWNLYNWIVDETKGSDIFWWWVKAVNSYSCWRQTCGWGLSVWLFLSGDHSTWHIPLKLHVATLKFVHRAHLFWYFCRKLCIEEDAFITNSIGGGRGCNLDLLRLRPNICREWKIAGTDPGIFNAESKLGAITQSKTLFLQVEEEDIPLFLCKNKGVMLPP